MLLNKINTDLIAVSTPEAGKPHKDNAKNCNVLNFAKSYI